MKKQSIFSLFIVAAAFLASSCSVSFQGHSLFVVKEPDKVSYAIGEAFASEGLSVLDIEANETVYTYDLSIKDGDTLDKLGTFTVDVAKSGYKSTSFNINVLHKLIIDTYPIQTFEEGEYFSLSGLILKDEDGVNVIGPSSSLRVGDRLDTPGEFVVTLSKDGYASINYTINVISKNQLKISHMPNKVTYVQGEKFTSTGLAIINGQTKETITGYTLSIKDGDELKTVGTVNVIVSKDGYPNITFPITIKEGTTPTPSKDKTLNIYYINDTHGSYERDLSYGDSKYPEAGMAYIGKYLMEKKAQDPNNTIILSGGDMFQGGVESNFTDGAIMVDAMNRIGFDAMTCGNHEFDWKPEVIAKRVEEMNFPLLSCNIFYKSTNVRPDFLKPYTVIEKDGYKVGVIGAGKQNLGSSVLQSISSQFSFPAPGSYIQECSDELRTSYQCDVVILVSHDGGTTSNYGQTLLSDYSSLTYTSPVSGQRYVDTLLFAHDHIKKSFVINNVPIMESACNGEYISNVTLNLKSDGGQYLVDSFSMSGNSDYAYKYCDDPDDYIDNLPSEKYYAQIGDPSRVLYYFDQSFTEDEFALYTCQILYWYVNENKNLFGGVQVYLSDVNSGTIRCSVEEGEFTIRDLVKVCPFQNEIAIQKCNSTNVSKIKSYSSITSYVPSTPSYYQGYTYGASISYCAEKYSALQKEYTYFGYTIYDAFLTYFSSGVYL